MKNNISGKGKVYTCEEENKFLNSIIDIHGLYEFTNIGSPMQDCNKDNNDISPGDDQMQTTHGHARKN